MAVNVHCLRTSGRRNHYSVTEEKPHLGCKAGSVRLASLEDCRVGWMIVNPVFQIGTPRGPNDSPRDPEILFPPVAIAMADRVIEFHRPAA